MADLSRRQLAFSVAAAVLTLGLGLHQLGRSAQPRAAASGAAAPIRVADAGNGRIVVHVAGAVRRPGVYRLTAGKRVEDAVQRAGGATHRADLGGLNLAAKLEDGRQVLVPARPPGVRPGQAPVAGAATAEGHPVNINTATLEQLDTLDGVGPATAQKILDFREEHGGFGSVEDLGEVPGIGEKRLAALREKVTV